MKKSSKPSMASDLSEVNERRYKQKLEADERALWFIYNSLALCAFPFVFVHMNFQCFHKSILFNELEKNKTD